MYQVYTTEYKYIDPTIQYATCVNPDAENLSLLGRFFCFNENTAINKHL